MGLRVIELAGPDSGIAGAYAGWLLARMGAKVARAGEQATGSAQDVSPPDTPQQLALDALAQGKEALALPAPGSALDALIADYDLILCDQPALFEALLGETQQSLRQRHPTVVVGMATIFGLDGPYTSHPAVALDAQALSGVAWAMGDPGRVPLTLPPGIFEHQAGAMLAAGSLLALSTQRRDASEGPLVDIAQADVLASFVAGNCRFYIHHGLKWQRSGRRASGSGGAYPFVILPCRDGEVCITGRTRDEWNRLVKAMGSPEWATEPRYQDLRAMGRLYPEEVDALLLPWLLRHSMAELEAIALRESLIVSPIRSMADVLKTRHFLDDGFLDSGQVRGRPVLLPTLPFKVSESRQADAKDLAGILLGGFGPNVTSQQRLPVSNAAIDPKRPLAGLRVIDMGWVWSAPWVGTILAELGAEVIKIEHALRPDNTRLAGKVIRDGKPVEGPSTEMSPMFHQINHGKLGITLNAKDPRAVALIKRLVACSDIVIENMSPGSMERQQLGYETLREINPKLVMLAMSSMGQFGELASMRSYAPTMSSFAGMEALVGYPGEAPIGALNCALGDPNASVHGLLALMAALHRVRRTGEGCYIDLAQIEALLGTLRPYLLEAQQQGRQPATQGNTHPLYAPHGIYPAQGPDRWLTLAVTDDAQWRSLCALAADCPALVDSGFDRASGRLEGRQELDRLLATWTATRERDELVRSLRELGIASSPVLAIDEAWRDPHLQARQMMAAVELPFYGPEPLFRAPWRFSHLEPSTDRSGPTLGQHNDQVFGQLLGLSQTEIAELKAAGVIA